MRVRASVIERERDLFLEAVACLLEGGGWDVSQGRSVDFHDAGWMGWLCGTLYNCRIGS